ncbi:MAG: Gfo/Idh/MocA family oxidoreductase [Pirellulales bacterium]|nr:Gfo/Idh/MocA family oxidoreductase [Pirellulales bacterium]
MLKQTRVAVIGSTGRGDYGHGLDVVWQQVPDVEIVGVADDNKQGLAEAAKRLGVQAAFADYRELLDKTKPEVVSIAPRWVDRHAEMVQAACERGIHVYLEKPFCRSLEEADAMVAACERSHVKLAIAHQTRYSPKLAVVRKLIAEGKLGRLLEIRARGKEDARGGAEDLWVLGTHVLDLTRALAGDPQWCQGAVTVAGKPLAASDLVEGNEGLGPLAGDVVCAMYGLPEGVTAYFNSQRNAAGRPARFGIQVLGTAGALVMGTGYLPKVAFLGDPGWGFGPKDPRWQEVSTAGIGKPEPLPDGSLPAGNVLAVKDLLAAIAEDRQPQSSVYDARAAIEMIVAVFESQRLGGRVSFPLANRKSPLTMLAG